jgi:hypothetical protein
MDVAIDAKSFVHDHVFLRHLNNLSTTGAVKAVDKPPYMGERLFF